MRKVFVRNPGRLRDLRGPGHGPLPLPPQAGHGALPLRVDAGLRLAGAHHLRRGTVHAVAALRLIRGGERGIMEWKILENFF